MCVCVCVCVCVSAYLFSWGLPQKENCSPWNKFLLYLSYSCIVFELGKGISLRCEKIERNNLRIVKTTTTTKTNKQKKKKKNICKVSEKLAKTQAPKSKGCFHCINAGNIYQGKPFSVKAANYV